MKHILVNWSKAFPAVRLPWGEYRMDLNATLQMIERFENVSSRLLAAIESEQDQAVLQLNHEIGEVWNELLVLEPFEKEATYELIEFFLGRIMSAPDSGEARQQSASKILSLVRALAS